MLALLAKSGGQSRIQMGYSEDDFGLDSEIYLSWENPRNSESRQEWRTVVKTRAAHRPRLYSGDGRH